MKRIDFLKTLGVLAAVPLLVAVETTSNHDAAIKKLAEYINSGDISMGRIGMFVTNRNITQMDITFIDRYLEYKHKPIEIQSDYNLNTGTSKPVYFTLVFKTVKDFKTVLTEVLPYITKFAIRDRIKKYI